MNSDGLLRPATTVGRMDLDTRLHLTPPPPPRSSKRNIVVTAVAPRAVSQRHQRIADVVAGGIVAEHANENRNGQAGSRAAQGPGNLGTSSWTGFSKGAFQVTHSLISSETSQAVHRVLPVLLVSPLIAKLGNQALYVLPISDRRTGGIGAGVRVGLLRHGGCCDSYHECEREQPHLRAL